LVAHKFLENVDIGEREKQETVNMCKQFHTSAAVLSEESAFRAFLNRFLVNSQLVDSEFNAVLSRTHDAEN